MTKTNIDIIKNWALEYLSVVKSRGEHLSNNSSYGITKGSQSHEVYLVKLGTTIGCKMALCELLEKIYEMEAKNA